MAPRILMREDPEVSELVTQALPTPKASTCSSTTRPSSSWSRTARRC
ncbi:MAG: hypothetical protein MZW92_26895 [Comamonadaceae bacterium]|nr:hypothetical protein [Comamonadaceae bacterium]